MANHRVLVVDDSHTKTLNMLAILADAGCSVVTASQSSAASTLHADGQ